MRRPHTRRRDLVDVVRGRIPADKIIHGRKLVNVITSEIYPADIVIKREQDRCGARCEAE